MHTSPILRNASLRLAAALVAGLAILPAGAAMCQAQSGARVTPVIELYTSQGCSSCPPADRWLSQLKVEGEPYGNAVVQAFHVAYWDYIGWADPFAAPAHTQRQRQIALWNQQRSIYTPQVVANGRDWRDWHRSGRVLPQVPESAGASISIQQRAKDQFEATVTLQDRGITDWAAYWTVTQDAFQTSVKAGENAGETLRNDHVVRQYTAAGNYRGAAGTQQPLVLHAIPALPGHSRTINLVVFDPRNGKTLQALATPC